MTDQELKHILQTDTHSLKGKSNESFSMTDKEFVSSVMRQIPQTDNTVRVVWMIRLVALLAGLLVLIPYRQTIYHLWQHISHLLLAVLDALPSVLLTISPFAIAGYGTLVAVLTLFFCRQRL